MNRLTAIKLYPKLNLTLQTIRKPPACSYIALFTNNYGSSNQSNAIHVYLMVICIVCDVSRSDHNAFWFCGVDILYGHFVVQQQQLCTTITLPRSRYFNPIYIRPSWKLSATEFFRTFTEKSAKRLICASTRVAPVRTANSFRWIVFTFHIDLFVFYDLAVRRQLRRFSASADFIALLRFNFVYDTNLLMCSRMCPIPR